jgi:hypothetical protein
MAGDPNEFQWQGKSVRVSARSVPRTLGLTASIDVEVGGRRVLETGGKFRLSDVETTRFNDGDGTHIAELRWRVAPRMPLGINRYVQPLDYQLRLDGNVVGESTVEFSYFPTMLMLTMVVGGALMLWLQHSIGVQFDAMSDKLGPR